ncbi:MAG: tetratricopeptide repeat protein, partial [Aquincola sp.]|nr:tetratricopeptide repeat protein [Aquincola sp.]
MVVVLAQHLHRLLRIAVLVPALVAAGCGGQSTEQLLASARTYLDKGDNAAAIIQLKNALQKDLKLAEARYLLGEALLRSGNPGDAALELRRAVEYGYAADKAVPALARALAAQGQSQVVVRDYANTRFDNPEATASLKTSLALAYLAEKSPAQADKALAEALQA